MSDKIQFPRASLSLLDQGEHSDALPFEAFADTMANLAGTVSVVAASQGARRLGRTVTAIASLSATPPSLLVSITRGSELALMIEATGGFSLSMLSAGQKAIANAFAGEGAVENRFELGNWNQWPAGHPRLEGAVANIDCRLAGVITLDTHCLYVGVLLASDFGDAEPLIWRQRGYRSLV